MIESVGNKYSYRESKKVIDNDIAWKVLFHSFNKDADVINLVKYQFENEEFPFSFDRHDMFQDLVYYFNGNNILIPAVEKWLDNRLDKYMHIDPEVAFAGILVHSDKIKNILLEDLPNSGISHWNVMALLDGWENDKVIKEKLKEYFRSVETKRTSASAHFISKVFDSTEKEEAIKILEEILFDKRITFRERAISALIEIDKDYFASNVLKKLIDELDTFPKDFFGQYYIALDAIVKDFHSNKIVQRYILERIQNDNSLYGISVKYFPELISNEKRLLAKSIPLSKELRLLILESIADLSILPDEVEVTLSNFETEAEGEVMSDMAVCLFKHIKGTNARKIIDLCKPLVFSRGFDYEVKRSIAFSGFLIANKLDEYFEVEDIESNSKDKSKHLDIFNDYSYRKSSSNIMIKSLIDNFDYLIASTDKGLNAIVENLRFKRDVQDIWGFFARHSTKSSPTYSHIMDFISNNIAEIKNDSIISFLNRSEPRSPMLKDILLRFINNAEGRNRVLAGRLLGTNFKGDNQVHEEVKKIRGTTDSGRIIALSSGWPDEPILKKIFDDLVESQVPVDNYVAFNLKFLFRDVDNLIDFLKNISINIGDIQRNHKFFFIPMIERLKKDKDFGAAIKRHLISSNSINEKISYYNLLSQADMVDDEVTDWKNKITNFKNDYGYDIVSNKTVRLKDILHDFYY